MQRTTGNSTVTTTANTVVSTNGLVIVGANAVRGASFAMSAGSMRSDSKPDARAPKMRAHGWRRHTGQQPADVAATLRTDCYRRSSESLLPPRLWASWVLSQSLCG